VTAVVSTDEGLEAEGLEAEFSGEICVVRLRGSLSEASVVRIRNLMERIRTAAPSSVLLDASLLRTLSDECTRALLALGQAVRRMGGTISAYGATGSAASALDALGR
jgi:anti-anti-sigma regulatory factor